ncbi:hypothetical protein MX003_03585 [Streptococcus uberis]|uniref:Uncharacterized protein n=1 Tax=Streptococcus uberis TaxID=1349 RepID=A0A6L6GCQ6_STRUB|nr:hypothetical protein [Streptococcus uberis]MCK1236786.1 hypothetical protein [Streptococcus uberis]MTB98501.1 hypothetical protein [Streptococcus uberis]MTC83962.1 hypothetical protein [Streptococcus uberis]MTC87239.1 hypothetical protein [Streptococcus uberis]MTD02466.1 hypothetical protein [Streptococcus uberis]
MISYQNFLKEKDSLSFEVCTNYFQDLIIAVNQTDEDSLLYWNDFISASVDYSQARGEWLLLSREEKHAKDDMRTTKHNKFIYTLKIFIAYSKQKGYDFPWFESIKENRKQLGDLACYISYIYAVNAR